MSRSMSSTNKGNYKQCEGCLHQQENGTRYPCTQSHRKVRDSGVKYERAFTICGLFISKVGKIE